MDAYRHSTGKDLLMHPTWGLVYWPIFITSVICAFAGPELAAFFTNHRNTLSDFAWYELGLSAHYSPHTWFWWVSLVATLAIFGTLVGHIWFQTPA